MMCLDSAHKALIGSRFEPTSFDVREWSHNTTWVIWIVEQSRDAICRVQSSASVWPQICLGSSSANQRRVQETDGALSNIYWARSLRSPRFVSVCFRSPIFFFPAVWQIIHFSTGVLPLIPQTSTPSSRSDNRIVSVQSISEVSLISYGNRASICWKLILGCDIVLIAILSPDAATQTNLVFGGSERTRPPDNAERKYIEGPSVCHSPTLYPLLSLAFTNTTMILKNLTFQAGTPTYRYTLPFYFVHALSQQTCASVRAFGGPFWRGRQTFRWLQTVTKSRLTAFRAESHHVSPATGLACWLMST